MQQPKNTRSLSAKSPGRRKFLSLSTQLLAAYTLRPYGVFAKSKFPSYLTQLTLREAAVLVKNLDVSPVELTKACLARIAQYDPAINAFITLTAALALKQDEAAEKEIIKGHWKGPLHGIPIALKDNMDTAGIKTTAASAVFANRVPTEDAKVVRRLKNAGAVTLGKLNMSEFNGITDGVNSYWGPIHNPWNLAHVPGGSSGGSAAAVAADFCYGALGTDTGGSIRVPASYCGVVGLKPTYGLVSNRGIIPGIESLDHAGPICKTVGDAALMLKAIAEYDPLGSKDAIDLPNYFQPMTKMTVRPRVGIPRAGYFDGLEDDVRITIEKAIEVLRSLGSYVHDVALPDDKFRLFSDLSAEHATYHNRLVKHSKHLYHPYSAPDFREINIEDYRDARKSLLNLRASADQFFDDIDFLVMPTLKNTAPKIDFWKDLFASKKPFNNYDIYNTPFFNVLGVPAISIPCGFSKAGLPIGLQIVAPPHCEERLLAFANAYEQVTNWHLRKPRLTNLKGDK